MKYKVRITKQPRYQAGGAQDAQQQIIQIVKAYAQKSGTDPKAILLQLQKMQPEEQQQALQQMAQSVQGGGDEEQATMKHGGRVFHQFQDGGGAQQQIMQIIQAFAQMQGVDPKEIMQQLQQMPPQKQQQAIQQMVQAVQQGQQQAQQQGPQEEQMEPQMAYGGQMGYGLDLGARRLWMNQNSDDNSEVTDSIEEVPREQANIEAEGGETALIPYQKDGTYLHKKIKGNRHTEGGVPLNVPEGTFIYSDTKKMKLGGPVLQMFGKSEKSTKKFTPATLAKQYNIDKYKAIMDDPKSDPIKKRTAELMLQNFQKKLSQLALVQESKKGFPQGIPEVARDYYQQMQQAEQAKQTSAPQNQIQQPQAMYGMGFRYGGNTPETRALGDDLSIANAARRIYLNPGDLDNWMNQVGRINPITQIARGISSGIVNTGAFLGNRNLQHEVDNTNSIYQNQKRLLQSRGVPFEYGGGLRRFKGDVDGSTFYGPSGTKYNGAGSGNPPDINFNKYYNPDLPLSKDQQFNIYANTLPKSINNIAEYTSNPDNWVKFPSWEEDKSIPDEYKKTSIPKVPGNESTSIDPKDAQQGSVNSAGYPMETAIDYNYKNKSSLDQPYDGTYKNKTTNTAYDNNFSNEWSTPDKLGMLNSLINLASVKRSTPFEPAVKLDRAETYYTDPSRALAANAEQMNAARQAASMFAGPQSRYSFNDGQYGANAANIIGQYATQNVGFGNQAAQQNAAINNQQIQYDTQRAKRLYDAGVIGEQQYQNAIREARAAALKSYAQGYKNSSTLYNLNKTTANDYIINQRTGLLNWNPSGGKDRFMAKQTGAVDIDSLRKAFPKADDNTLAKIYASMYNSRSGKRSKSNQSSNSYGYDDDQDD